MPCVLNGPCGLLRTREHPLDLVFQLHNLAHSGCLIILQLFDLALILLNLPARFIPFARSPFLLLFQRSVRVLVALQARDSSLKREFLFAEFRIFSFQRLLGRGMLVLEGLATLLLLLQPPLQGCSRVCTAIRLEGGR